MEIPEKLSGAVPPHSVEAETSVLGAMLQDGTAVLRAAELLKADDFYLPEHREIFQVMQALNQEFRQMAKQKLKAPYQVIINTAKTTALYHLRWAPCMSTTAMRNDVKNGEVFTVTAEGRSWYQVIDNRSGRTAYIVKSICQVQ